VVVKSGTKVRTVVSRSALAAALLATVVGCSDGGGDGGSSAEGADKPFEGETIDFVVPFDPGGGYDVYTRTVAPYLGECLGAEMVVRNEPGAGSLLATGRTATSKPDGLRIQIFNMPGVVGSQIAGAEGVRYDLNEFSWIGRIAAPPTAVVTPTSGDITDFQSILDATDTVQFVATGPGSSDYVSAAVIAGAYGIPYETTTGFAGAPEATNAVIAGDADAHVMPFDSVISVIDSKQVTPAVVIADELPEYMPDAPLIGEFEPTAADGQDLLDGLATLAATGRAVGAPPGLPEDKLTALREGFTCAMEDPKLLEELATQERPVDYLDGEEYAALVKEALAPSAAFAKVVKASF
jgi:tripartite-type tricarboxylate transporter receptor subunit TctC